jgi:hypothetical protein
MALYELRTYTLYVGKMAEATKLYQELGFPALKKGSYRTFRAVEQSRQIGTCSISKTFHQWIARRKADAIS